MTDSLTRNDLLKVLRSQHKEAKKRREVTPLRDWCASLELSTVIGNGTRTDAGFYPSEEIKEALPAFHKETGGLYQ